MIRYKITLQKSQICFYYDNSISLLEAIERLNLNPEYGCRYGFCGTCSCPVLLGEWTYRETPIAFFQPNEILLCCAQVTSDLILDI